MPLAKRIAGAVKEVTGADGINVVQNNEPAAGQTVFHFHMHIIPRFTDDGCGIGWPQKEVDEKEQAELATELAEKLSQDV